MKTSQGLVMCSKVGILAKKPQEVISWSFEDEAPVTVETTGYCGCQNHGSYTKKGYIHVVDLRRQFMCVVGGRIGRVELLKPLKPSWLHWVPVLDTDLQELLLGPVDFWLCFALITPQFAKILPFGMGLSILCHCVLKVIFLKISQTFTVKRLWNCCDEIKGVCHQHPCCDEIKTLKLWVHLMI